ncbi:MAG: HAMP domain-containing histidine kinase [bacterium]|nr:HAMP domain-containing histidine kinase [bacterium]
MEILALYTSPEMLPTALAAGARHLAAVLQGFAVVYQMDAVAREPSGWAGFTCAQDAQTAGEALSEFLAETNASEKPIRTSTPTTPARIWQRSEGGVYGFPLRHNGQTRGVALLGCPETWPRVLNAEIESILRQITLVLDHHAATQKPATNDEPSDDLLKLSEQLFAQDLELIKKDDRLHAVERLKSDLIETMSYELRAPLNRIIEQIISVLANEHENLSEQGRGSLRGVLDDGNSLMRMLQNILDLWRVKQGEIRIELQDVNLAEVIEEAIFNVRDTVKPDVVLSKLIPPKLPKVRTDLAKLNQILFHLLDNATKFTKRGRISLEMALDNGQLSFAISDTGIGISPDDRSEIFEEFHQVDTSPDRDHRGAGLGLTLAKALVEHLGGSMSLTSEIGRGSRFAFVLPVAVL